MNIYGIAGYYLVVSLTKFELDSSWSLFDVQRNADSNLNEREILFLVSSLELDSVNCDIKYGKIENIKHIFCSKSTIMLANQNYKYSTIQFGNKDNNQILLNYLFYSHTIQRKMLQMHCSMVEDNGRGILFLGPSGIGKTTQAERWAQYHESVIINGDVGYVQQTGEGFLAWGTPWHGSSPYCVNTSVPLKAMVVLKQSKKNELRELSGFEKVREVSGNVFYPTWLEDGVELCTNTLNTLLNSVPVYCLDNRADEEAVKLLAKEIDRIT